MNYSGGMTGFSCRFLAFVLDLVLVFLIGWRIEESLPGLGWWIAGVGYFFLEPIFLLSPLRAGPGMLVLGLKVESRYGGGLVFRQAMIRQMGWLHNPFHWHRDRSQAHWDLLSGSQVVGCFFQTGKKAD